MNEFGREAAEYWQTNLPRRYRALEDPEAFFSALGQIMEQQITTLSMELLQPGPHVESIRSRTERNSRARAEAEEQVRHEFLYLPKERHTNRLA